MELSGQEWEFIRRYRAASVQEQATIDRRLEPYGRQAGDAGSKMTWLKDVRREKELTQEEVARAVNIKRASYGNIESGARKPSVNVAKRIADVLGFEWTRFYESA